MHPICLSSVLVAGCLCLSSAWAEAPEESLPPAAPSVSSPTSDSARQLTRAQAVAEALAGNPDLRVERENLNAARARRLQADGFDAPTVSWEVEEARAGGPDQFGSQIYGIEQSVEWVGVRNARKQTADAGVLAAEARLARVRARVTARTHKAFDRGVLAQQTLDLIDQVERFMREAVDLSRIRFKSGAGSYVDVLRTRIAQQRLQSELRDAELTAREANRALAALIGLQGETVSAAGELEVPPFSWDRRTWLASAQSSGPSFLLIRRQAEQASLAYRAVRRERAPEFTFGIGRQRLVDGMDTDSAWAGQIGLKVPLPGSDRQRGRELEARAAANAVQDRGRGLELMVYARLEQRFDEAEAWRSQVQRYETQILPDVEDQRRAAQQDYRVGRIDALNLLDVYRTYLETRRDYFDSVARYRAAWVDLETFGEDLWEIEQ